VGAAIAPSSRSYNPPASGAEPMGGSNRAELGLCGACREPAAAAIGVQTQPIVVVSVHELRVFTDPTEDPSRLAPAGLLVERLHATTVSHLGEIAIGRRAKRRSVESRLSFDSRSQSGSRGTDSPRSRPSSTARVIAAEPKRSRT
jgi:hypothetical protein